MQLYTFTARSLAEALRQVRSELGLDASVLHTREVGSPLARLLLGRRIEVTASPEPDAPSRLPSDSGQHNIASPSSQRNAKAELSEPLIPGAELQNFRRRFRQNLNTEPNTGTSLVEQLAFTSKP